MSRRIQDLTRFKKTYSYSRQSPVLVPTTTRSLDTERDLTRFRKSYSSVRSQPVMMRIIPLTPPAEQPMLSEDGSFLVTEGSDQLITEQLG